ncbi:MAG: pyridoxal 5'-phosphate synthase glutaminase subunit PdxT [candidate division Zixibacteria bacterium]|nr:pyridoxal 5'-phosphate synthase glutaminase subunit PdxT [candidate division Zixibacteria bacterium]
MEIPKNITVGVLAIQGDFERHLAQLDSLGVPHREVRLAADLDRIDGLILPGGESTTMDIMIDRFKLREPLTRFCRTKPVYGTCAGMILLSRLIRDNQSRVKPLNIIDIEVLRNGYGRQLFSSDERLEVNLGNGTKHVEATFIRAPKIVAIGSGVEVLARRGTDPVLVKSGKALASAFHNELGGETAILRHFLTHYFV